MMPVVRADLACVHPFRENPGGVEFLFMRRAAGEYLGGTWQPVYGTIRENEKAWQAALRELREETGLAPERFYFVDTVETFYMPSEDVIHHAVVFAARINPRASVLLDDEHEAFEWLPVASTLKRCMWPGQRRAVREIVSDIIKAGPAAGHLEIPLP